MTINRVQIQGSDGTLIVDGDTGEVLERNGDGDGMGGEGYPYIVRFNVETLTGSHLDILECGFWDEDGAYEAPDEEFMNECRLPALGVDVLAVVEDLLKDCI